MTIISGVYWLLAVIAMTYDKPGGVAFLAFACIAIARWIENRHA